METITLNVVILKKRNAQCRHKSPGIGVREL